MLEKWAEDFIIGIFQVTLSSSKASPQIEYLEGVASEQLPAGAPGSSRLNTALFDAILVNRLISHDPIPYISGCYRRAVRMGKSACPVVVGKSRDEITKLRDEGLKAARNVMISYSVLTVAMPEMWDSVTRDPREQLLELMQEPITDETGLPQGFLDHMVARVGEGALPADVEAMGGDIGVSLGDLVNPMFEALHKRMVDVTEVPPMPLPTLLAFMPNAPKPPPPPQPQSITAASGELHASPASTGAPGSTQAASQSHHTRAQLEHRCCCCS